jgi:hypothetical protein
LKREAASISACRSGSFLATVEDTEEEDASNDEPTASDIPFDIEEGDRVWATGLIPEAQYVQATSTISQRLAYSTDWQKRIEKPNPRLHLWTSLFGRAICETPELQTMGSCHRAGTGGPTEGLQGLPNIGYRTIGTRLLPNQKP